MAVYQPMLSKQEVETSESSREGRGEKPLHTGQWSGSKPLQLLLWRHRGCLSEGEHAIPPAWLPG